MAYYRFKDKQMVSDEFIYDPKTSKKVKHFRYSSDGLQYWETQFDENETKTAYDIYKNKILIVHQEFKNKKKHGSWLCINKNGAKCVTEYNNGKKIKPETRL
ncbi:hypothetical protein [Chryseobacterium sp. JUb7]|uniref:hypothetical protein n=1 Tax=Chryseobacterium sp. JUb7 TaxID=2940599 RepID=UPI002168900F|nr:hypothetical protein [Chryseobacterium sp. JUb7]MCS3529849.1 hypothetical protein [Chryseobacterium sp. JUb7]